MTDLEDFEETHTHEVRTSPLMRGLIAWVVLLTIAVGVLSFYLIERRGDTDKALCAIVRTIPRGDNTAIDQARTVFCR